MLPLPNLGYHFCLFDYSFLSTLHFCCADISVVSCGPSATAAICLYLALCGARADNPALVDVPMLMSRKYGMFGIRHAMRHSQIGNEAALDDLLDHCLKLLLPDAQIDELLAAERTMTAAILTPDKQASDLASPLPIGKMLSFPSPKHTVREEGTSPGPPSRRQRSMHQADIKSFNPINAVRHSVV